eukprot:9847151-Alexandrium_andersonii.AAC.1
MARAHRNKTAATQCSQPMATRPEAETGNACIVVVDLGVNVSTDMLEAFILKRNQTHHQGLFYFGMASGGNTAGL